MYIFDLKRIQEIQDLLIVEITLSVPDHEEYLLLQDCSNIPLLVFYNINHSCPKEKAHEIERIIRENTELIRVPFTTDNIE